MADLVGIGGAPAASIGAVTDQRGDVVASPETSNVGKFCSSGVFADLKPFLTKSKIDAEKTFPKAMLNYTQFEGNQCSLPLLGDAYGLYYNKTAFSVVARYDF